MEILFTQRASHRPRSPKRPEDDERSDDQLRLEIARMKLALVERELARCKGVVLAAEAGALRLDSI